MNEWPFYLWTWTRCPMIANIAYRCWRTCADSARGCTFILLTHLRCTAIVIRFTFVSTSGKRWTYVAWHTATYRHVINYFTFSILATRTGVALFFYNFKLISILKNARKNMVYTKKNYCWSWILKFNCKSCFQWGDVEI